MKKFLTFVFITIAITLSATVFAQEGKTKETAKAKTTSTPKVKQVPGKKGLKNGTKGKGVAVTPAPNSTATPPPGMGISENGVSTGKKASSKEGPPPTP